MPYSSKEWKYEIDPLTIYQTNGYTGTDADIAGTELFTDDIDLTEYTNAEIDFKFDANDATDDLYLHIYKRGDITWTGTELRWKSRLVVENSGAETIYHYTIPIDYGSGHYRFGMVRSGATTTFDIEVKVWLSRTRKLMRP